MKEINHFVYNVTEINILLFLPKVQMCFLIFLKYLNIYATKLHFYLIIINMIKLIIIDMTYNFRPAEFKTLILINCF